MNSLVGQAQSSFIEGRHILDIALIARELIDTCKRKKTPSSVLKIDFHKAFDSVSWKFLDWTLDKMNFCSHEAFVFNHVLQPHHHPQF